MKLKESLNKCAFVSEAVFWMRCRNTLVDVAGSTEGVCFATVEFVSAMFFFFITRPRGTVAVVPRPALPVHGPLRLSYFETFHGTLDCYTEGAIASKEKMMRRTERNCTLRAATLRFCFGLRSRRRRRSFGDRVLFSLTSSRIKCVDVARSSWKARAGGRTK